MHISKLLYIQDCYMREFDAEVTGISSDEQGNAWIELGQTAFYSTGGGQPYDTGVMISGGEEYKVLEVKKSDGTVLHKIDRPGLAIGDKVHGNIDWERRYRLMRYHTAAHILCAIAEKEANCLISGNELYTDKARFDFTLENFDRNLLQGFEAKANEIINRAIPINFKILPREEAFKIPSLVRLQKGFPESIQEIRIVDIQGFDVQACGGTHLHNTSEIKGIKIYDMENKGKGRKRVYFRILD